MRLDRELALFGAAPLFSPTYFPLDRVEASYTTLSSVSDVIKSGCLSMFTSSEVELFEREFAAYLGVKECVLVTSGTNALMACFSVLNFGGGARIAAPAFSYIGTCSPGALLGTNFIWLDCLENDPALDPQQLAERYAEVDGVVLPMLFGDSGRYREIIEIVERQGIPIVFDCAQLMEEKGIISEIASHGPCCFSFGDSKILRVGEGGAIATNSSELAERIRLFRHQGEMWTIQRRSRVSLSEIAPYEVLGQLASTTKGINLRPTALTATFARGQLTDMPRLMKRSHSFACLYSNALSRAGTLTLPRATRVNWWSYPVVVKASKISRDVLVAALLAEGVPVGVHFPKLLPEQPLFGANSEGNRLWPNAEYFSRNHFVLPLYPTLGERHINDIANCVETLASHASLKDRRADEAAKHVLSDRKLRELCSGLYMFLN